MEYVKLREQVNKRGLSDEEATELEKFANNQRNILVKHDPSGDILVDVSRVEELINLWKNESKSKGLPSAATYHSVATSATNSRKSEPRSENRPSLKNEGKYVKLREYANNHGVWGAEATKLETFANNQRNILVKHDPSGDILVDVSRVEELINLWRHELPNVDRLALRNAIKAHPELTSFAYYIKGISAVDALANPQGKSILMTLRIDVSKRILIFKTANLAPNPIEYPVKATLPLDKIIWASMVQVPTGEEADGTYWLLNIITSGNDRQILLSTNRIPGTLGIPKPNYKAFIHKLQTFSPFYRKEDGVEYFDVHL